MDEVAILEQLEKVAAIMRKGGFHRLTRFGRNVAETVLRRDLSIQFDDLHMSAPIGLRGFLYRVRSGRMEPYMSKLFCEAVRPNSIVLDVGACLGYYTLLAAKRGANVYAFEPDESVFAYLETNVRRNGLSGLVVGVPKAVGNTTGVKSFFINESPDLNSFFSNTGEVRETVEVDATTVDDYLDDAISVNVMKIDVEGAEFQALDGMERTIARSTDVKMFIESNPHCLRSAGHSADELISRLEALGFLVMIIDEENARLRQIKDVEALRRTVNLYCTRAKRQD